MKRFKNYSLETSTIIEENPVTPRVYTIPRVQLEPNAKIDHISHECCQQAS